MSSETEEVLRKSSQLKLALVKAACICSLHACRVPTITLLLIARVYNKEGGRVSYSSIVPCTAVVRVQARLMISQCVE